MAINLFSEGHVQDVCVFTTDVECMVKTVCLPEMKKGWTYVMTIIIDKSSCNLKTGECSCPAGRGLLGSCKHLAALCFNLEEFVKIRDTMIDLNEEACTYALQKWNQPRNRRLDSTCVEEISFKCPVPDYLKNKNKRCERKGYDPWLITMRKTTTNDFEEFCSKLDELPTECAFLHLLSKPSIVTVAPDIPHTNLPLLPRSVQSRIKDKLFKMCLPPTFETLQELRQDFIDRLTPTSEQRAEVKERTRAQATCVQWHEERYCRLTASNFGSVINCKFAYENLARTILDSKIPETVRAIKWGREHESVAY